jgi:hypothetical protein
MFIEELNPIYETTQKKKVWLIKEVNPIVKQHKNKTQKGFGHTRS